MESTETGESLTIKRVGSFRISYIKPCTLEKGRKMVKIMLDKPPAGMFKKLQESGLFDGVEIFPKLGIAKLKLKGKEIVVLRSGEVTIRAARDEKDALETAELLAKILKP